MSNLPISLFTPRTLYSAPESARDRPVLGAFMGTRGTLLVDAGASAAHAAQFRSALSAHGAPQLRFCALTHWHWDHVFGLTELGLPACAHFETRRRVLKMAQLDWRDQALDARVAAGLELAFIADHVKVELSDEQRASLVITAPDICYRDGLELDLGGLTVQVLHVGGDHSPDCSVIYSPEEQVAFLGDCFCSGFLTNAHFYTLKRLLPLLETLESLPVEYYIHGHDAAPQTRAQFLHDAAVLRRTGELVEQLREREAVLAQLPAVLGEPLNEYSEDDVDSFLTGLSLS